MKKTWDVPEEVIGGLETWCQRTKLVRNDAVSLGIWLVTRLDPISRQDALDRMQDGWDGDYALYEVDAGARLRAAVPPPGQAPERPAGRKRSAGG